MAFAPRVRGHPLAFVCIPVRGREVRVGRATPKKCKPCMSPGLKQALKAEVVVEGSSLLHWVFLSLFKTRSGSAECNYSMKGV